MILPRVGIGLSYVVAGFESLVASEQSKVAVNANEESTCEIGFELQALFASTAVNTFVVLAEVQEQVTTRFDTLQLVVPK